jgi:hypothetical protein
VKNNKRAKKKKWYDIAYIAQRKGGKCLGSDGRKDKIGFFNILTVLGLPLGVKMKKKMTNEFGCLLDVKALIFCRTMLVAKKKNIDEKYRQHILL